MKIFFIEGQRVFSPMYGAGTIISTNSGNKYPIIVRFDNGGRDTYTNDGRSLESLPVTLSQKPLPPIVNEPISEQFAVDDWVVITIPEDFSGWVPVMKKYNNRVVRVKEVIDNGSLYILQIPDTLIFSSAAMRAAEIDEIPV